MAAVSPDLSHALIAAGAGFPVVYGALRLRAALAPNALATPRAGLNGTRKAVLTTRAFTWLNPHVYLDMLGLGAIRAGFALAERPAFTTGAVLASLVLFFSLVYGARLLTPVFAPPARGGRRFPAAAS